MVRSVPPKIPLKKSPRGLDKLGERCYSCCMATEEGATIKLMTDDFLSVGKAAKALGTSRWSVYRWIEAQKIIAVKLGGVLFIPTTEVERLNKQATGVEPVA